MPTLFTASTYKEKIIYTLALQHAHTHTRTHTYLHNTFTHVPTQHMHTRTYTTHAHTYLHNTFTHVHTYTNMHTHTYTTHAHTYIHNTCTHIHTQHMHTRNHTWHLLQNHNCFMWLYTPTNSTNINHCVINSHNHYYIQLITWETHTHTHTHLGPD